MISIRKAALADAETITDINTQAFNDEMRRVLGRDGGPPGYNTLEEHKRLINTFLVYVVLLDDQVIGSCFLVARSLTHFRLESFCIHPQYQNKGYGYETLRLMERKHPEVTKWTLGSMKGSERIWHLYEKFGYVRIGENEHEFEYEKITG